MAPLVKKVADPRGAVAAAPQTSQLGGAHTAKRGPKLS